MAIYIQPRQSPDIAIPDLIKELIELKKGRKSQLSQFHDATTKLSHLLQADIDVFDIDSKQDLHINGVTYRNASSGTETSLAFFGLTRLGEQNCLILWDEPENGLHPTRRSRLLQLMFNDSRQYILATHASEFAPILYSEGKVFRCFSEYNQDTTEISLNVSSVANRRDAFAVLEAIGVHPAKTLFTANVVIWVEGPTELLFYRHWLAKRLNLSSLVEGFHYTFMQYGGALISYLSVADDVHANSVFDLLSLCRHPVILVDSDFRSPPGEKSPISLLKNGAQRISNEIENLNLEKPGSALFMWTSGKEIENYLPEKAILHAIKQLWSGAKNYENIFKNNKLEISQYNSYHEEISNYFINNGIIDNGDPPQAKGRSIWGSANKVEMMHAALSTPNLLEEELLWECSQQLRRIEEFIKHACGPVERL